MGKEKRPFRDQSRELKEESYWIVLREAELKDNL